MRSPADQSSADDATALSLIEFLQVDQRPALILDLRASDSQHASLSFCNAALRHNHTLHRLINGHDLNFVSQRDSDRFHKWAAQEIVPEVKDPADTYSIHSWTWTRTTLRRRWRVLVASSESIGGDSHSQFRASDQTALKLPTTPGRGRFALDDDKRRHWDLIEAVDWSSTELGPMATWSRQRREICDLIMTGKSFCQSLGSRSYVANSSFPRQTVGRSASFLLLAIMQSTTLRISPLLA